MLLAGDSGMMDERRRPMFLIISSMKSLNESDRPRSSVKTSSS
ncbi:hypothetical protein [Alteribacillus sp. HJP-4]